ncbi:desampylase [Halalkalicoccus paucihalophilus]|uniref:Desampylase n=1 Tax=Halalkalicoccus paucihalophilus TaxID=1008153 RepID=A0A151AK21_9EURY|nr:desampylase [Halalkalicoccus paucihalophilus]KYH27860.1 desampylase [Halalkalicoccus paucihalophilus]
MSGRPPSGTDRSAIEFEREAYGAIIEHARAGAPEEVCGVLGGEYGAHCSRVRTVRRAENAAENPETRYAIDPAEAIGLIEGIEKRGEDLVGFYHSHPVGPTEPSRTDTERAAWPGKSYVIVALDGEPFVGAWRWNGEDGRFEGETVRLLPRER